MEQNVINTFNVLLTFIKNIEPFDGRDVSQLPDFIAQVENLMPTIDNLEEGNRKIIFAYVRNKCIGKTRDALHREGVIDDWNLLKETLKLNFGEIETCNELMDKLKTITLDGTIENYYNQIQKLVSRINNRMLTHNEDFYSHEEIKRIALKTFKNHLPEPTKTLIFARDPNTLDDAYKIIIEARHQFYTQRVNENNSKVRNNNHSNRNENRFTNQGSNQNPNQYNNYFNGNQNNNNGTRNGHSSFPRNNIQNNDNRNQPYLGEPMDCDHVELQGVQRSENFHFQPRGTHHQ